MKGRENNLEGLMATDFAIIEAGKGKKLTLYNSLFALVFIRAATYKLISTLLGAYIATNLGYD